MKHIIEKIPLLVLIVAPVPLILTALSFYFNYESFQILEERYAALKSKQKKIDQEDAKVASFVDQLNKADPHYLENQLEPLKLRFVEETFRVADRVQETEMRLQQPVELTEEELKQLLVVLDRIPLDAHAVAGQPPQLLIKQLHLSKKPLSRTNSLYLLNMQLIKRESPK
jgi:hypothetical protein